LKFSNKIINVFLPHTLQAARQRPAGQKIMASAYPLTSSSLAGPTTGEKSRGVLLQWMRTEELVPTAALSMTAFCF
jgi:hypothetical protein